METKGSNKDTTEADSCESSPIGRATWAGGAAPGRRYHFGPRSLDQVAAEIVGERDIVVHAEPDPANGGALVALVTPENIVHVARVESVAGAATLRAALGDSRVSGLAEALAECGLQATETWVADLAYQVLHAGEEVVDCGLVPAMVVPDRLDQVGADHDRSSGFYTRESVLDFAARAQYAAHAVAVLRHQIDGAGLTKTVELEHRVRPVVEAMQRTGIHVDRVALEALLERRKEEASALELKGAELLGVREVSDAAIAARLRELGRDVGEKMRLPEHFGVPGVSELHDSHRIMGFIGGFGASLRDAVQTSPDGRVHGHWRPLGTSTGRITCRDLALCSTPRDPSVRGLFGAEPGNALVVLDLDQAQVRIAAEHLKEERMIAALKAGVDAHRATAAAILGIPVDDVSGDQRELGKPFNFRLLFGAGIDHIVDAARDEFELNITRTDAAAFADRFFDQYPAVGEWHERVRRDMPDMTRSLGGRICRFSEGDPWTARLAAPIQGTEADIIKTALVEMTSRLEAFGAKIVLVVYDEIVVEAPESRADHVAEYVEEVLQSAWRQFIREVPLSVTHRIARTWAKAGS